MLAVFNLVAGKICIMPHLGPFSMRNRASRQQGCGEDESREQDWTQTGPLSDEADRDGPDHAAEGHCTDDGSELLFVVAKVEQE